MNEDYKNAFVRIFIKLLTWTHLLLDITVITGTAIDILHSHVHDVLSSWESLGD